MSKSGFARRLLGWYSRVEREFPWRRTRDPYHIWVSEIMLQQTRAQAVLGYYERFLARFPTVEALAAADDAEVLALWSGLGYYSRARNLLAGARQVARSGIFPRSYEAIRALPGVGPYTAAAIASIAFGLPHAVVDGNVLRVIARLKNDPGDIAQGGTRARFQAIADQLLDHGDAGRYNQALMELGATICLARAPQCLLCPVARDCQSLDAGTVHLVPVKGRGKERQNLSAAVAIVERHGRVLLRQRAADARLMAGFWELPPPDELPGFEARKNLGTVRHTITHHHYTVTVVSGELPRAPRGCRWVGRPMLGRIPLTTLARKALAIGG